MSLPSPNPGAQEPYDNPRDPNDRAVHFDGRAIGMFLEHHWDDAIGSLSLKLVGLCTVVFLLLALLELLGVAQRQEMWSVFGLSYPGIFDRLWLHQFVTAPLIHSTVAQLVFTSLSLWLFGPGLERQFGRGLFILFIVLCAGACSTAFLLMTQGTTQLFLGLSGVTSGIFCAQAMMFADHVIPVRLFFRVKMKYAVYLLIGMQVYLSLLPEQPGQRLAALTQLFGIAVALLFVWIWRRRMGYAPSALSTVSSAPRLQKGKGNTGTQGNDIPSEL